MVLTGLIGIIILVVFNILPMPLEATNPTDNLGINAKDENYIGNTVSNIMNGGFIAQQGEWVYFGDYFHSNEYGLYKIKTDLTGRRKLSNDKPEFINVVGDWIFYKSNHKMFKIKTDGSKRSKISNDDGFCIIVYKGWIYYVNSQDRFIYKIDFNGKKRAIVVCDRASNFSINNGFIYYTSFTYSETKLFKATLDANQIASMQISEGYFSWPIFINDKKFVYLNTLSDHLVLARTDNLHETVLVEEKCFDFNVASNGEENIVVYLTHNSETSKDRIRALKMDSFGEVVSKTNLIVGSDIQDICVLNDWVYFKRYRPMFDSQKSRAPEIHRIKIDRTGLSWISRKE